MLFRRQNEDDQSAAYTMDILDFLHCFSDFFFGYPGFDCFSMYEESNQSPKFRGILSSLEHNSGLRMKAGYSRFYWLIVLPCEHYQNIVEWNMRSDGHKKIIFKLVHGKGTS